MVREAVKNHAAFSACSLNVFTKGSYRNNTNVRADSDVDIAVECQDVFYYDGVTRNDAVPAISHYEGVWTPSKLRSELQAALEAKFGSDVDATGSTALQVNASSARVDADVVPCFSYRDYMSPTSYREGTRVFKKDNTKIENYPTQQYENGVAKNVRTARAYKKTVRILKRLSNFMVAADEHRNVQSFFVECLAYNCPDNLFLRSSWVERVRGAISHIWSNTEGAEPTDDNLRWLEVNDCKYLFHSSQPWSRKDARDFAYAAWNYLGFKS